MIYTNESHIKSVKDVEAFFHHIVYDRKVNFHPDDSFEDYIDIHTKEASFTSDECNIYNRLMDEAFEVCEREGVDIYEIGMNELFPMMGLETK